MTPDRSIFPTAHGPRIRTSRRCRHGAEQRTPVERRGTRAGADADRSRPASAGTYRAPRARSPATRCCGSGSMSEEHGPRLVPELAVTMLKSSSGLRPGRSMPSSSSTACVADLVRNGRDDAPLRPDRRPCRPAGDDLRRPWPRRDENFVRRDHPAIIESHAGRAIALDRHLAPAPTSSVAPAARARAAKAFVAAAGSTGKPVSSRHATRSSATAGSSACSSARLKTCRREVG